MLDQVGQSGPVALLLGLVAVLHAPADVQVFGLHIADHDLSGGDDEVRCAAFDALGFVQSDDAKGCEQSLEGRTVGVLSDVAGGMNTLNLGKEVWND